MAGPLLLAHLGLASEELFVRLAVAATHAIPQGGKLAVVVIEVEMVHCVTRRAVHQGTVGDVFAVMDEDSPEVDETEQEDVGKLLQGENEREDVVGHTLGPAVKRVESMGGKGTRHDPLVVRLVQGPVDARMVQTPVDPVNEEIGEADEDGKLQDAVEGKWLLGDGVIEFGIASDLENEEWRGEQGHWRHCAHGLLDLQGDLIPQELGVVVRCLVPDENV